MGRLLRDVGMRLLVMNNCRRRKLERFQILCASWYLWTFGNDVIGGNARWLYE